MDPRIAARLSTRFVEIPSTLRLSQARERLAADRWGIVLDADRQIVSVVGVSDMGQPSLADRLVGEALAQLPPTALFRAETLTPQLVLHAFRAIPTLEELGVHAALALGDEGVVGVLPVSGFRQMLSGIGVDRASIWELDPEQTLLAVRPLSDYLVGGGLNTTFRSTAAIEQVPADASLPGGPIDPWPVFPGFCGVCGIPVSFRHPTRYFSPPCPNREPPHGPHKLDFVRSR